MSEYVQQKVTISAPTSREVARIAISRKRKQPDLTEPGRAADETQQPSKTRRRGKVAATVMAAIMGATTLAGAGPASAKGPDPCPAANGGSLTRPASIDALQRAIDSCASGQTLLVRGHFRSRNGASLDDKRVDIRRPITLSGRSARLTDIKVGVRVSDVRIERIYFVDNTQEAVVVGRGKNAVQRTEIVGNRFVRSMRPGTAVGAVIWVKGGGYNSDTRITDNIIRDWGRPDHRTYHAIKIGTNRLQYVDDPSDQAFISRPNFAGTTILRNRITGGPDKQFSSAVQLNNPSLVRNNCIKTSYNGISAKSGDNVIWRNTLRDIRHAALYQRDGSENLFGSNLVTDSDKGFWNQSGERVVFLNNKFVDNSQEGVTHGAYHSGSRAHDWDVNTMPVLPNSAQEHLKGQTSFQFVANNTLFAYNTFENSAGDIYWDIHHRTDPEGNVVERPTQMWFFRNSFDRKGRYGKLMGAQPPVPTSILKLNENTFSNNYHLDQAQTPVSDVDVSEFANAGDGWSKFLRSDRTGANQKVGTAFDC